MTQPAAPAPQAGPQGAPTQPPAPAPPSASTTGQPQQQPATPPAPPWGDPANFDPERAWALIQNQKAELAQTKARNAELAAYEQQVKALEEANKTELQRAQEAAAQAQKDAEDSRLQLLRHQVANREGRVLPPALAERLRGSTREELEADADALLAAFPQAPAAPVNPQTPVTALRPGALPTPPPPSLADQITAAEKSGDIRLAIQLKNEMAQAVRANQR